MVTAIPATGTTINMGGVWAAYTAGVLPIAGDTVSLNAVLGVTKSGLVAPGAVTPLSETFGGRTGPFNYV
jgi:hypothetical protein